MQNKHKIRCTPAYCVYNIGYRVKQPNGVNKMEKSKLIQKTVEKMPELESYHVEECDGKTHHWVMASDGFRFPDEGTISICGFNIRDLNREAKTVRKEC
jgi:hypothetical protein